MGNIRVIAGAYKNKPLQAGEGLLVRPSKNQMRAAILNTLASRTEFHNMRVLDLYCGSGALGIECLSRGAAHVTFVDTNTQVVKANLKALGVPAAHYTVVQTDALHFQTDAPFDIIFADPPYRTGQLEKIFARAALLGAHESLWVMEEAAETALTLPDTFTPLKQKRFGKSAFWVLEQKA